MYRKSTTETIMHSIGQNNLLIYPYFGNAFQHAPQFVNSKNVRLASVLIISFSSLRNIIQTSNKDNVSHRYLLGIRIATVTC